MAPSRRPTIPREFARLVGRLGGGRLVYGRPVKVGDRAVVPVSRVRIAGGFGFGSQEPGEDGGGGGGGLVDARPSGFIEVGPDGARYEAIPRDRGRLVAVAAGVAAGVLAGSAIAGTAVSARALRRLARSAAPTAKRVARRSSRRARHPWLRR
ncbi:MAG: hypothetical protein QOI91_2826 [Solirubrobacteraceae bacterium]|nr:hypothetical protein [Solirubrobacteraceae bacterium]